MAMKRKPDKGLNNYGRKQTKKMTEWTRLPELVIDLIGKRLCLPDLFRFSCVCKPWSFLCDPLLLPGHLPWLILPFTNMYRTHSPSDDITSMAFETENIGVFSLYNRKIYKAEWSEICNRRICGSFPGGWLMTVHANSQIQLFQPFSTKKTLIHIPPLTKFPSVLSATNWDETDDQSRSLYYYGTRYDTDTLFYFRAKYMRDRFIYKVAISSSSIGNGTFIMAIQGVGSALAFYKLGGNHDTWTLATPSQNHFDFHDITYYKGKFYAVQEKGCVIAIHGLEEETPYGEQIRSQHLGKIEGHYYIVNALGDLLVVQRFYDLSCNTVGFKVFKAEFGTVNSWVEVDDLGDRTLFLGYNSSFCLVCSRFSGCKANSIYFTDNSSPQFRGVGYGSHDLGVFNLEDGMVEELVQPRESLVAAPPPIWFAPFSLS